MSSFLPGKHVVIVQSNHPKAAVLKRDKHRGKLAFVVTKADRNGYHEVCLLASGVHTFRHYTELKPAATRGSAHGGVTGSKH